MFWEKDEAIVLFFSKRLNNGLTVRISGLFMPWVVIQFTILTYHKKLNKATRFNFMQDDVLHS